MVGVADATPRLLHVFSQSEPAITGPKSMVPRPMQLVVIVSILIPIIPEHCLISIKDKKSTILGLDSNYCALGFDNEDAHSLNLNFKVRGREGLVRTA